jgi:hypothetical protein
MTTQKKTLQLLCGSIITRLENKKSITLSSRLRQVVRDEVFALISPIVLTDEDLRERALSQVETQAAALEDAELGEASPYRSAKSMVRGILGAEELNGFYFQRPPKLVAQAIVDYLMRSSHIDDVYETDEELEQQILQIVREFVPHVAS